LSDTTADHGADGKTGPSDEGKRPYRLIRCQMRGFVLPSGRLNGKRAAGAERCCDWLCGKSSEDLEILWAAVV
jgi:hypothetical protein